MYEVQILSNCSRVFQRQVGSTVSNRAQNLAWADIKLKVLVLGINANTAMFMLKPIREQISKRKIDGRRKRSP